MKFSTILGGVGDDSIVNFAASNTITGGEGADIFDLSDDTKYNANISDYDYNTDKLKAEDNSAAEAAKTWAEADNGLTNDGTYGKMKSTDGAGGAATIQSSNGFFAVNLTSGTTNDQVGLAWVGDNAVTIDGSAETKSVVITGATNRDGDLLVGGAKGDTLYAGNSDSIYGGAGADSINATGKTGVYVGVGTASGKDTVKGFVAGFDSDKADTIYMVDGSVNDVSVSVGASTIFTDGKGSLELTDVTDANAVKLLVNGAKVYAIAQGKNASVSDSDSEAAFYVGSGTGGGVDYSKYGDALMVNLSQENFQNINSVKGGTGDTSLIGSTGNETLMAGTGGASLYGGAGKDTVTASPMRATSPHTSAATRETR